MTNKNTAASFIAWCFGLEQTFFPDNTRGFVPGGALSASQEDRVLKVFDANYSDTFLTGGANATENKNRGAALQLAVWDAIYDDDFNLDTGTFKSLKDPLTGDPEGTVPTPGDVYDLAQDYLAAADGSGVQRKYNLFTYSSDTRQDFGGVQVIPLPAAAWLLMDASGGLIAAKRRQARRVA